MLTLNKTPLEQRTDLNVHEKTMWRTLIRVDHVESSTGRVGVVIPGWAATKTIYFKTKDLRPELVGDTHNFQELPYRFLAPVNIGVANAEDLYIDLSRSERR